MLVCWFVCFRFLVGSEKLRFRFQASCKHRKRSALGHAHQVLLWGSVQPSPAFPGGCCATFVCFRPNGAAQKSAHSPPATKWFLKGTDSPNVIALFFFFFLVWYQLYLKPGRLSALQRNDSSCSLTESCGTHYFLESGRGSFVSKTKQTNKTLIVIK